MNNPKYTISFFQGKHDRLPKVEEFTFQELRIRLSNAAREPYISKDELEGMVCGEFAENKRATEHLTFRSIITYDIDNYKHNLEKLIKDCASCLKDIKYLYYTTISSTFDKPRIRVLIFPNSNIVSHNYSKVAKLIAEDLFNEDILEALDRASYTPVQLMYVPSLRTTDFRCKAHDGIVLNIDKYNHVEVRSNVTYVADFKNIPLANLSDEKVIGTLSKYDVNETDYYEWFTVCQALHHQYSGSEKGLEIFRQWSLRDSRYSQDTIIKDTKIKYQSVRAECERPITFASVIAIVNEKQRLLSKGDGTRNFESLLFEGPTNEKDENGNLIYIRCPFIDVKRNEKDRIVKVFSTYRNFQIMCKHYGIEISYDVISKENVNNLGETQNSLVSILRSAMTLNGMDIGLTLEYINLMAKGNKRNGFRNALDKVIWDGQDRLKAFYKTLEVKEPEHEEVRNLYLLKWLQQMLYLALYDPASTDGRKIARNLLVLQSDQQCGKSTWFKALLPDHLSDFIGEGLHLNSNNDMSVLACIKHIFVELAELEQSFKTTDINQFKAFFGRTKDILNIKYLPCPEGFIRTTSFLGTVNEVSFLKDKTGSTRFLVLPIKNANGFHGIDMMQLYKQIYEKTDYINFELNKEEQEKQRLINEEFQQPDVIEEQFRNNFETEFTTGGTYRNCTQILEQLGYTKRDINYTRRCDIANVLRKYNFDYRKKDKHWLVKLKGEPK
jgi:hypothetical protein